MRLLPGSKPESSLSSGRRNRSFTRPLTTALALGLFGFLALGLVGARPAAAADATMSPFETGRHVYDYGHILSTKSARAAEALAVHIEASGGGRAVIYTEPENTDLPDTTTLAKNWNVDGLLMNGSGANYGNLKIGDTLKGKLSSDQSSAIDSSPGPQTLESWMVTTLARVDAFLNGTRVFDGAGALDATAKQKAEAAAASLSSKIGAPVYIDIAIGGKDPSTSAFFNGAELSSDFHSGLIIALAVSDTQIAGYLQSSSSLYDKYHAVTPWKTTTLDTEDAAGGDVQAALLAAIDSVKSGAVGSDTGIGGSSIHWELVFWIVFAVAMVFIGVGSPFYGAWLIRKLTGVTGPIKGGLPSDALIQSIADTGVTVTMPSVGPNAPEYKLDLLVTPVGGGEPYAVQAKAFVPRLFAPMVLPGRRVGVLIDPANPMKISLDFSRIDADASGGADGESAGAQSVPPGGFGMSFDASGQPAAADVASLASGLRSGTVKQIRGSADHLLATGTHGTAVITTAMPLGKTVRDVNPAADPSRLDDPMWLFTVEVSVAGENPFPAVFGHRVPIAKVVSVAPGVKLAVAVDLSDKHNEVAIDWDKSPMGA